MFIPAASPDNTLPAESASREPRGCRFIHGDPPGLDWHYCQDPRLPGSPYCAAHHALCHVPADKAAAHMRALIAMVERMTAS